ncbi:MAG: hypothetical protein ACM3X9_09025 [Bacillota bacterium]
MSEGALAIMNSPAQPLQKSKPRYTEAENKILFESWWDPQKRRELVNRLGRKMSALRSQFCRLLKEEGLSNQEYYNIMQSKYANGPGATPRRRSRELKEIDRTIIEVFCKHQALGNSRTQACEELQGKLGTSFTAAALKLRFYRLVKRLQYSEADLLKMGQELLGETVSEASPLETDLNRGKKEPGTGFAETTVPVDTVDTAPINIPTISNLAPENSFFYQLSSLPQAVAMLERRVVKIEENQRHQLDLRGFIEHLLAVERDVKREDKLMEEIQRLIDENELLKNAMEKERERLKNREDELSGVYKMLNTMLEDFMRLESVSKLASLGDFMHRLEITVDQFGNVLKSRRVVS